MGSLAAWLIMLPVMAVVAVAGYVAYLVKKFRNIFK
jgi:hypothetical protein